MGRVGHHMHATGIYSGTYLFYTDEQLYTRIALSAALDGLGKNGYISSFINRMGLVVQKIIQ